MIVGVVDPHLRKHALQSVQVCDKCIQCDIKCFCSPMHTTMTRGM